MYEYMCWFDVGFSLYVDILTCMSICTGLVLHVVLYVDILICMSICAGVMLHLRHV